jgi:Cu-processing system ATP-binding protein
LQVSAPDGSKLALLRQLLAQDDPTDVEIKPPSLEDLYRHYMVRAAAEEASQ